MSSQQVFGCCLSFNANRASTILPVMVPLHYICRGWGVLITTLLFCSLAPFSFSLHDTWAALSVLFVLVLFHHLSSIHFCHCVSDSLLLSPAHPDSLRHPADPQRDGWSATKTILWSFLRVSCMFISLVFFFFFCGGFLPLHLFSSFLLLIGPAG